jgi:DNA-directed RNA polymerase specialized sigma24 family protein
MLGRPESADAQLERHRVELTGYSYRMLGSSDAEDAVQETTVQHPQAHGEVAVDRADA